MAEQKSNSSLGVIYILLWAIMPLVYISDIIVDNTLVPRQLFTGVGLLLIIGFSWKHFSANKEHLNKSVVSYLAFFIISILTSIGAVNTVESISVIAKYGIVLSFLVLTSSLLNQKKLDKETLVKGIVVFGLVSSLITLFQLFKAIGSGEFFQDIYIIKGSFSHKNLLSSALMLTIPFAMMGRVLFSGRWKQVSTLLIVLLIIEVFILRTRGVWLSVIASAVITMGVYFLSKSDKKKLLKLPLKMIGMLSVLAIVMISIAVLNKGKDNGVTDSTSFEHRLAFWSNSIEMIKENPITGVGSGNWRIQFPKHGLQDVDFSVMQGITQIQRPHNDYLWVFAEGGVGALLSYVGVFLFALIRLRKNLKESNSEQDLAINLSLLFGLVGYLSFSLTDFPMERVSHSILAMTLIALTYYKGNESKIAVPKKILRLILVAICLFSLWIFQFRWQGEKGSVKILQSNAERNAPKIIKDVESTENRFYNMDNYSNPLRYYSSIGHLFLKKNKKAWSDLQIAKDQNPYNILILNQMGNVLKSENKIDEAIALYDQALAIAPRFEQALLNKAEISVQQKNALEAMSILLNIDIQSSSPKYLDLIKNTLPVFVAEAQKHQKFKSMVQYIKSQNPVNRDQYFEAYKSYLISLRFNGQRP